MIKLHVYNPDLDSHALDAKVTSCNAVFDPPNIGWNNWRG